VLAKHWSDILRGMVIIASVTVVYFVVLGLFVLIVSYHPGYDENRPLMSALTNMVLGMLMGRHSLFRRYGWAWAILPVTLVHVYVFIQLRWAIVLWAKFEYPIQVLAISLGAFIGGRLGEPGLRQISP